MICHFVLPTNSSETCKNGVMNQARRKAGLMERVGRQGRGPHGGGDVRYGRAWGFFLGGAGSPEQAESLDL